MAKETKNSTRQIQKVTRTIAEVKKGFPQFLGFELLFRLLGFVLFAPLTAWVATQLISSSSSGAISNYDIAGFLLSVKGVAYVTTVVTIGFALVFFESGGLITLAAGLQKNLKIPLPQLFRFLGLSLPRLWRLSVRQFLHYLLFALPCLALVGGAYFFFLTESDIKYYLQIKPPEFWYTAGIAGFAAAVFAFCALRLFISWIYSVPILLLEERSPSEALQESERLTKGRSLQIALVILKWAGVTALLFLGFWAIIALLKYLLLGLAGQKVALVLTMTSLLAFIHFLGSSLISIFATSSFAYVISRHYLKLRPELSFPKDLAGVENSLLQRASKFLKAGWVLVLACGALTVFVAFRMLERIDFDNEITITAHRGSSITAPAPPSPIPSTTP